MYPTATKVPVCWKYCFKCWTSEGCADEIGFSTNKKLVGNFFDAVNSISRPGVIVPRNAGEVPIKTASGSTPICSDVSRYNIVEEYASFALLARFRSRTFCARAASGSIIALTRSRFPRTLNSVLVYGNVILFKSSRMVPRSKGCSKIHGTSADKDNFKLRHDRKALYKTEGHVFIYINIPLLDSLL